MIKTNYNTNKLNKKNQNNNNFNMYFTHKIAQKEIKLFLKNIFNQDKNKAYRRDNYYNS